jgi:hypothetical protein
MDRAIASPSPAPPGCGFREVSPILVAPQSGRDVVGPAQALPEHDRVLKGLARPWPRQLVAWL